MSSLARGTYREAEAGSTSTLMIRCLSTYCGEELDGHTGLEAVEDLASEDQMCHLETVGDAHAAGCRADD